MFFILFCSIVLFMYFLSSFKCICFLINILLLLLSVYAQYTCFAHRVYAIIVIYSSFEVFCHLYLYIKLKSLLTETTKVCFHFADSTASLKINLWFLMAHRLGSSDCGLSPALNHRSWGNALFKDIIVFQQKLQVQWNWPYYSFLTWHNFDMRINMLLKSRPELSWLNLTECVYMRQAALT